MFEVIIQFLGGQIQSDHGRHKDFVLLALLCAFLAQGPLRNQTTWEMVEYFSGLGRLSRLAAKAGFPTASFDLNMDAYYRRKKPRKTHPFPSRSYMDMNGEAGFAFLGSTPLSF